MSFIEATPLCDFYRANKMHCIIDSRCLFCGAGLGVSTIELAEDSKLRLKKGDEVRLDNFGPLDGTYRVGGTAGHKLRLEFVR